MKTVIHSVVVFASIIMLNACQSTPLTPPVNQFKLTSSDIQPYQSLTNAQVASAFGCQGANKPPVLSWSNAPANTKSYAITMYDPDAPTGSGFWHWVMVNIPSTQTTTSGGITLANDAGMAGFLGACPPVGEKHRYIFTIYALDTPNLDVTANTPNAVARFMLNQHIISSAKIETYSER